MGYENEVPPVPTREEEKQMLEKIMDNFQEQSSVRYYMNESLRINKLEHFERRRHFIVDKTRNFFIGFGLGYTMLSYFKPAVRQSGSGVPVYKVEGINYKIPTQFHALDYQRFVGSSRTIIGATIIGYLFSIAYTSSEEWVDEDLEYAKPILPY